MAASASIRTGSGLSTSARIVLLIVLVVAVTLATAGLFKAALEQVLPRWPWLQEQVRLEVPETAGPIPDESSDGSVAYRYDLGRATRRHLLLVALVLFFSLRHWLPWGDATRRGLFPSPLLHSGRQHLYQAGCGLGLALVLVLCYAALLLLVGRAIWSPDSAGYLARKTVEYTLAAALVAGVEELFFRGVMFRSMLRDWGVCAAASVSSAIYAVLHCISGSYITCQGWQPWVGSDLLVAYYTDSSGSVLGDLRLVIGLFLLGWVLAYLYLRTGSLWMSIGLHGGIILFSKLLKKLLDRPDQFPEWLLGDPVFIVSGVLSWLLLLAVLVIVIAAAPRGPLYRHRR